jgi:hypothetical protein
MSSTSRCLRPEDTVVISIVKRVIFENAHGLEREIAVVAGGHAESYGLKVRFAFALQAVRLML